MPNPAENDFQAGLAELINELERISTPATPNPYQNLGQQVLHEHDTRRFFFDRFLVLLGWRLGLHGNVMEEARIKAETTTRMDYLGVRPDTKAPALLVEAKSWDRPFVRPRGGMRPNATKRELIVEAISHIRQGGTKSNSPVTNEWHEHLEQVSGYVNNLKAQHDHDLPCALLASGQWMVIFISPVSTFINGQVDDKQFKIFELNDYVKNASEIYSWLSRQRLGSVVPVRLRPTQLRHYITRNTVAATYYALLISYKRAGASLFRPRPQIEVYPALIIQRDDGALLTVIQREESIIMQLSNEGVDVRKVTVANHLAEVADHAANLLRQCSQELDKELTPLDLRDFPGFPEPTDREPLRERLPRSRARKNVVRRVPGIGDEWLYATGTLPHYLLAEPRIACRFHSWASCHAGGYAIGPGAVNTAHTETPRSFFTDDQVYHCAHQTLVDRREDICRIQEMDQRTCCSACAYLDICWNSEEVCDLPCGG